MVRTLALVVALSSLSSLSSLWSVASAGIRPRPSDAVLRKELSLMQYEVTQQGGTEPPSTTPTGTTTHRASTST